MTPRTPIRQLVLFLLAAMVCAACDRATPPSPAPGAAPRLVVLSPAAAIILRDLGHQGVVVGRHAHDLILDPALPICGDQAAIDLEALIDAGPSVVVTQWGSRDLPPRLVALAGERGWRLHEAALLTLDDIEREIDALDRLVLSTGSKSGLSLKMSFDRALSPRGPDHGRFPRVGRVLLLASVDPPGALGPASCHAQVLTRIGASSAITQGAAWVEMDAEDLVRLDPDAIVLILPRSPDRGLRGFRPPVLGEEAAAKLGRLRERCRAADRGRVVLIDDPRALTPSTAMIDLADALAGVFSEWEREATPE